MYNVSRYARRVELSVKLQLAIDRLQARVDELDVQLDSAVAGDAVGVGITADYIALQYATARMALDVLQARCKTACV